MIPPSEQLLQNEGYNTADSAGTGNPSSHPVPPAFEHGKAFAVILDLPDNNVVNAFIQGIKCRLDAREALPVASCVAVISPTE